MAWKDKTTVAPGYYEAADRNLSRSKIDKGARVAVIGAGVFGGWTALHLRRKGFNVSLFDPWGAGNSRSSSGGETRLMRCVYGRNSFYTQMACDSWSQWEALEMQSGKSLLAHTGNLWLAGSDDTELRLAIPIMERLKLPFELLSPGEAARLFPYMNTEDLGFVLWEKKSGVLRARESCLTVLEQFVKEGGRYYPDQVQPVEIRGRHMQGVLSTGSELPAFDCYIFACGPWLVRLFPFLSAMLKVSRQEVFYFGVPPERSARMEENLPSWIDMSDAEGYYGIPGRLRRGFKVASDLRGPEIDPTTERRAPDLKEVERAGRYLSRRFPFMTGAPLVESRVCQYTNTPDGNFILDQHPEAANVWLVGGGSGHGFKHGPAFGLLAAEVISGEKSLPFMLSLDRFKN